MFRIQSILYLILLGIIYLTGCKPESTCQTICKDGELCIEDECARIINSKFTGLSEVYIPDSFGQDTTVIGEFISIEINNKPIFYSIYGPQYWFRVTINIPPFLESASGIPSQIVLSAELLGDTLVIPHQNILPNGQPYVAYEGLIVFDPLYNSLTGSLDITDNFIGSLNFACTKL